jgi:galactonate dehydratase
VSLFISPLFCTFLLSVAELPASRSFAPPDDLLSYLKNPEVFDVEKGFVKVLSGPGLGIEINEELVRQNAEDSKGFHWANPIFRSPLDGSIREW